MSPNTSSAVMQQRVEAHDSLDDFPTPCFATRALCEALGGCESLRPLTVWEPAANRGSMVRPLAEYFGNVRASDVHDYGAGYEVRDFLMPYPDEDPVDWIISNPPFRLAEQFIERGLELSTTGVAMLVRIAFLEGIGRYERLFSRRPPSRILQFTERVPMFRGRLDQTGSTATAYAWVMWLESYHYPTVFDWIPPSRKRLERDGDYPAAT